MLRRFHVPAISEKEVVLGESDSRHARDVLRLENGAEIQLFDDAGGVANGVIVQLIPQVVVRPGAVERRTSAIQLTVAAAVPKGERADWMVEKLCELGCAKFIPITAARSVVVPGKGKLERWSRIATEAAKQSRRAGVMTIAELTELTQIVAMSTNASFLNADADESISNQNWQGECTLLIGPEGGWTEGEIELFKSKSVRGLRLTDSILRVETAAVAAAAVVLTVGTSNPPARP